MIFRMVMGLTLASCFLCSCQSQRSFKKEGNDIALQLALELELIQTKEELQLRAPKIKKKIEKLTKLMMEADSLAKNYSGIDINAEYNATLASDRLLYELHRINQIEGAREVLEKIQRDSLDRLDEFDIIKKVKKYRRIAS